MLIPMTFVTAEGDRQLVIGKSVLPAEMPAKAPSATVEEKTEQQLAASEAFMQEMARDLEALLESTKTVNSIRRSCSFRRSCSLPEVLVDENEGIEVTGRLYQMVLIL